MSNLSQKWRDHQFLLKADKKTELFYSHTGAGCIGQKLSESKYEYYLTVRNNLNQSLIFEGILTVGDDKSQLDFLSYNDPVLTNGSIGMFDENGVSYPHSIIIKDEHFLLYTGWMQTVKTPFQNHLGMAKKSDHLFERVSKAPILPRSNEDPLSTGSVCVLKDSDRWHLWYTSFLKWGEGENEPKHSYSIKYAYSHDGFHWNRQNQLCIDPQLRHEHSIARPSVIKYKNLFHMWFCYRGEHYKIGYATSIDGIKWERKDHECYFLSSGHDWDSKDQCYPHIFKHKNYLYMTYAGNNYGNSGIGIARMNIEDLQ